MPMVPEQIIAMLACARIGAIHSIVFAGFGVTALNPAYPGGTRGKGRHNCRDLHPQGKAIPLITTVQESILNAPSVEHLTHYRRNKRAPGRDQGGFRERFLWPHGGYAVRMQAGSDGCRRPFVHAVYQRFTGTSKGVRCTRARAIWWAPTTRPNSSSISKRMTSTGVQQIPVADSPGHRLHIVTASLSGPRCL